MIIACLGPAGAGKSTVAAYLASRYGASRHAFATPFKEIVRRAFLLDDAQVYGTQAEKARVDERYGLSGREFLTRVGQATREVRGPDCWLRWCLDDIASASHPLAVIEDCRYVNEARGVQAAGGIVWLIPPHVDVIDEHPSESEWRDAPHDFVIRPPVRGLDALHAEIDRVMLTVDIPCSGAQFQQ